MNNQTNSLDIGQMSEVSTVDNMSTSIPPVGGEKKQRVSVYLRVSDKKLELDRQKHHIKVWLSNNKEKYVLEEVYMEKVSSRGGVNRKQLNRMMKDAEAHRFDVALFWSVDRFGRNVKEGLDKIEQFWKLGIDVYIAGINMFWTRTDIMQKTMLQMMLVFAEFESDMIKTRTKEGMEAKNAKLKAHGDLNGIEGMRIGTPSILENWVRDPYARPDKKGWSVCRDRDKEELFKAIWNNKEIKSAYREIEDLIRIPAVPNCVSKCHSWNDDGTIINKSDDDYMKQKCLCNKKPSRKAIHKARVKLELEPRNIHSWKRKGTFTSWDALETDMDIESELARKEGLKGDSE
jgi:DNA invertase Pin-like site-specific DNA recombinase